MNSRLQLAKSIIAKRDSKTFITQYKCSLFASTKYNNNKCKTQQQDMKEEDLQCIGYLIKQLVNLKYSHLYKIKP